MIHKPTYRDRTLGRLSRAIGYVPGRAQYAEAWALDRHNTAAQTPNPAPVEPDEEDSERWDGQG